MKQIVFMVVLTLTGTLGVGFRPFLGVAVYYLFAVLRPQFLWQWSLPSQVSWSYYVALATLSAGIARLFHPCEKPYASPLSRFNHCHIIVLGFGAWIGITYLTARAPDISLPWMIEYAKIFLMFTVAALLLRTITELWSLFTLIGLALGYIAYEINFLYLINGYLGIQHNGYGGLDNNGAGLMLAMGVPICYFSWEGCVTRWRWLFLALVPVILHAVLMTYSRGAMVSLLVVSPLIALLSHHRARFAAVATGLLILLPFLAGPEIRARFMTISSHEQDESAQSRRDSWHAAWLMARDNPVFGVGVRNANIFSHQYGADLEGRTIHSQFLQIAADNGFVGLSLYIGAIWSIWIALRQIRKTVMRHDPGARQVLALAGGIECSLAVFCVGGLFLSLEVVEQPYVLLLLGAQLSSVVWTTRSEPEMVYPNPVLLTSDGMIPAAY